MNPWVSIIAQYGFDAAIALAKLIAEKINPTPEEFLALKEQYGSKSAEQYLAEAMARLIATGWKPPVPPTP